MKKAFIKVAHYNIEIDFLDTYTAKVIYSRLPIVGNINFWGNELTLHSSEEFEKIESKRHNVDMGNVTVPHFGVHISAEDFANLKERLAEHKIKYIDEPYVRFEGTELEQETMFIADPYGNAMEIKTMKNPDMLWRINK